MHVDASSTTRAHKVGHACMQQTRRQLGASTRASLVLGVLELQQGMRLGKEELLGSLWRQFIALLFGACKPVGAKLLQPRLHVYVTLLHVGEGEGMLG